MLPPMCMESSATKSAAAAPTRRSSAFTRVTTPKSAREERISLGNIMGAQEGQYQRRSTPITIWRQLQAHRPGRGQLDNLQIISDTEHHVHRPSQARLSPPRGGGARAAA